MAAGPLLLLAAFAAALIAALLLTPLVRAEARRTGRVAAPRGDRWHRKPTALMGGTAIFLAFFTAMAAMVLFDLADPAQSSVARRGGLGIILAATVMFAAGVVDDRLGLRPASKLILEGTAAAIVVSFGVVFPISPWVSVNVVVTIFWFIALTNALNLLDNMDGVATGVAAISAAFLAATFGLQGDWFMAALCAALAGATLGFLPYNWHPASIFMGDSGSLFLGALLAGLGAAYPAALSQSIFPIFFIPALIVAIPILDTALVTVTRILAGRSPAQGGRDHTTHRLVAMGLSERQAALVLFGLATAGGCVGLVVRFANAPLGLWSIAIFVILLVLLGTYLTRLHTYVPSAADANAHITHLVSNLLYKRRAFEVVLDIVLFALAYYTAYMLRWDAVIPSSQHAILAKTLGIAVASQSVAFGLLGVYRGAWHQITIVDVHRILKAAALGTLITVVAVVFVFRTETFARGVFVIQGILVAILAVGTRASVLSFELVRVSLRASGSRTLIYGAGRAGELALRELQANPQLNFQPVGFIDDDEKKRGHLVHGLPVCGPLADIEAIIERYTPERIVLSTGKVTGARLKRLVEACQESGLELLRLELKFKRVDTGAVGGGDDLPSPAPPVVRSLP